MKNTTFLQKLNRTKDSLLFTDTINKSVYKIPHQDFDQVKDTDQHMYLSKQIKNELWMWIADTKKITLTNLKNPCALPKGYFNLQNYIVKQIKATVILNQKWQHTKSK